MKTCTRCGLECETKEAFRHFNINRSFPDGLDKTCRKCSVALALEEMAARKARKEKREAPKPVQMKTCVACGFSIPMSEAGQYFSTEGGKLKRVCEECEEQKQAELAPSVFVTNRKEGRSLDAIEHRGCILLPVHEGRCKHRYRCLHYSECLDLVCEKDWAGWKTEGDSCPGYEFDADLESGIDMSVAAEIMATITKNRSMFSIGAGA